MHRYVIRRLLLALPVLALSSLIVFGLMRLPYFYVIAFVSGFLSLIPYLGVVLALLPPLLVGLGQIHTRGAAFDTRLAGAPVLTGRASKTIAKLLERHGIALLAPAESFLVARDNQLQPGEQDRAGQWGRELAALLPTARPTG